MSGDVGRRRAMATDSNIGHKFESGQRRAIVGGNSRFKSIIK